MEEFGGWVEEPPGRWSRRYPDGTIAAYADAATFVNAATWLVRGPSGELAGSVYIAEAAAEAAKAAADKALGIRAEEIDNLRLDGRHPEQLKVELDQARKAAQSAEAEIERLHRDACRHRDESDALYHRIDVALAHLGRWAVLVHSPPAPGSDPEAEGTAAIGAAIATLLGTEVRR